MSKPDHACRVGVGRVVQQLWLLVLLVITGLLPAQAAPTKTAAKYSYYTTGTVYFQRGNVTPLQPLPTPQGRALRPLVLMGGGPDVDDAYRWMIDRAGITPASGGRFVVIRTTGTDAYDPYLYYSDKKKSTTTPAVDGYVGGAFLGLSAAETLVLSNRAAADDDFVNTVVGTANAVWIAGGDQSSYVNLWQGTKLNATLKNLLARNIPLGGTSAGANVMGQFVFSALNGSVTSAQALGDPYNSLMTFDPTPFNGSGFFSASDVPALQNTFVDPHFDARDRMGRLVAFVSRSVALAGSAGCSGGILNVPAARGIGVDVETALAVEADPVSGHFMGRRMTNASTTTTSAVHFLTPLLAPQTCLAGTPLTVHTVEDQVLADSTSVFDFALWWLRVPSGLYTYTVDESAGVQTPVVIPY